MASHKIFHHKLPYAESSQTAFFGLLRASEYLVTNTHQYVGEHTLLTSDISFALGKSFVSIFIKKSKTDPFRQGFTLRLWATNNNLCPVVALSNFHKRCVHFGPLFRFTNGSFLTRAIFSDIIQQGIPDVNLNTHSFRIGGASTAHAAGIPDSTIQTLGRWASDAYQLYLRIPSQTLQNTFIRMSETTTCEPWYPITEELGEGSKDDANKPTINGNKQQKK